MTIEFHPKGLIMTATMAAAFAAIASLGVPALMMVAAGALLIAVEFRWLFGWPPPGKH